MKDMKCIDRYRVDPKCKRVCLADWPTDDAGPFRGKQGRSRAESELSEDLLVLDDLQRRLWAEGTRSLLVVLQAMDAGGKDGTIRKVFGPLNPQGFLVSNFKKPTPEDLAHDFLWRIHRQVPAKGQIGIFNRSHYEDVLVVKVHGLADAKTIRDRYDQINAFEALLASAGTTVIKLYLHLSKVEQLLRFEERLDDPDCNWKFNPGDLVERELWDEYRKAFETALARCSPATAPWYVVPADRKWYRNWLVAKIVRHHLEDMDPQYPEPAFDPDDYVIPE